MARVAVLDADVLIGHLDSRDVQHERATDLLRRLVSAGMHLRASTITLAEVLVGPADAGREAAATAALAELGVEEVPFGEGAVRRLARLRADTGCRLPDCCVLLAVEDSGAGLLGSFDRRLGRAAGKLGIELAR